MLFDEKELNVFDNNESRTYFKEILQSYYSQNYRATIVLLYSFVIYDLFIKLQTMASEGDKKANNKSGEVVDTNGTIVVSCGDGNCVELTVIQLEGKKRMDSSAFLNGYQLPKGTILGK